MWYASRGIDGVGWAPLFAAATAMYIPSPSWETAIRTNPNAMGLFFIVTAYILTVNITWARNVKTTNAKIEHQAVFSHTFELSGDCGLKINAICQI